MKKSSEHRMTATDVADHQQRTLGTVKCTCRGKEGHSDTCPMSLFRADTLPAATIQELGDKLKKLGSKRQLKKHRGPTAIEAEFGHKLERDRQAGEIEDYIFEGVTLRWGDMAYTADYFVIRQIAE